MSRSLPQRPNLEHVKREAKRILRSLRHGDDTDITVLRLNPKYAESTVIDIKASATLADVHLALARDYGFDGWTTLKRHVESLTPVLSSPRPVLKVGAFDKAVEHYVDWLGFTLEWEWREAPGRPVIAALSRDGVALFLNEYPEAVGPASFHIHVENLDALVDEWNDRRPGSVEVRVEPPYEFPDLPVEDAWGNVLVFEGQDVAAETKRRNAVRPKMRAYVEEQLEAGRGFPTPEEVRDVVGPPLGTAIEVLNEFPGYGEAFEAREHEA